MFHKYFTMYFNYNIYRFSKHTVAYLSFQRDIIVQLQSTILAPCLNEHIYRLLVIVSDRSLEATKTAARENQKERQEEAINFHRANLFFPSLSEGKNFEFTLRVFLRVCCHIS